MIPAAGRLRSLTAPAAFWSSAVLLGGFFLWIVVDLLVHGHGAFSWSFLATSPVRSGRSGGILPVLVSTLLIIGMTLAISLPVSVGTALALTRGGSWQRSGSVVGSCLDILASTPSIVFGLFGNAFFCKVLGLGFSILAGSLTLSCMVLPIMIRTAESGLRAVPVEIRTGAAALGMTRTRELWWLSLPLAAPALLAGTILAVARAGAETAALLFTSGYVDRMPETIRDSGRALSVHIYDLAMNIPGGDGNAYRSAVVLVILLLCINAVSSVLTDRLITRRVTHD